jgi:N-acetylglucosaminyl-diphospho-decaprenol L-rhamnosyltransferase
MAVAPVELAVVIVNFNAGDHLLRSVSSALESAGEASLDVVIVDNASSDGSAERAARTFPSVRLVSNAFNRGFAAAANQGIAATAAPYVFLLNPDAEVSAGTLGGLVKLAEEHPRVGALGVLVRAPDGSIYPSARTVPGLAVGLGHAFLGLVKPDNRYSRAYTMADWDRRSERDVEWVSGAAMLLRRAALEEVGPFDEGYFMYVEDVDLCTRLRRRGWAVRFTPELEVAHEGGVSTARSRRMFFEHARSASRYFARHRSPGPLALLRPFVRAALWARAWLAARKLGARD